MEKYLRDYAEPETASIEGLADTELWKNVLVIPACGENSDFLRAPPPCGGRSLMILVINQAETASLEVSSSNRALADTVCARFQTSWQSDSFAGISLHNDSDASRDILLVDRFSKGRAIPAKGGVGHARKIGADLAANLIRFGRVHSSWIHCTDADVRLPQTYFTGSESVRNTDREYAALIYPFQHSDVPDHASKLDVVLATQLYEVSLRYYVAGMKFAGSPYAFHTIGSTMAVSATHYAKVRGFPKREAGEDFYLLNKLAKVGSVRELEMGPDCQAIKIEARRSDRVPFGTGAAVNKITGLLNPVQDFRFYHPTVFELLQAWLGSFPQIWRSGTNELSSRIFPEKAGGDGQTDRQQTLLAALHHIKAEQALEHAFNHSREFDQFNRHMHTWFDAFRTLKLIHKLRDLSLKSINYAELEASRSFACLLLNDPDLSASRERFRFIMDLSESV